MRIIVGLVALLGVGCSGDGKQPDLPPDLSVTPDVLDFGTVGVGSDATLDVVVANLGGGTIDVLSVNLTEGDADIWSVDRTGLTGTLSASEQGLVVVTFSPEDNDATYIGQVQIRTTDDENPSFTVALSGRGGLSNEDYDGDGVSVADGDCDDGNASVFPGAEEICDGIDNNCDGVQLGDEVDADYDGWLVCEGDCDDADGNVFPGAVEICDYKDTDCDNVNADTDDNDADGFSICDGDCDDLDANASPALPEVCDGIDNNCDGGVDDIDLDGDGHSVCSAAGDCDDNNPNAFPVVVDANAGTGGVGTDADPYDSITTALANLDQVCRTVILETGTHPEVDEVWATGEVVTIVGRTGAAADVTLEAAADSRHFQVTTGSTLNLQDLTLTGGDTSYAGLDGGAISVANGTLTLSNVRAVGNVSGADGGALAVSSGTLVLGNGCVFDGNAAGDDGGAIAASASTVDDGDAGTLYTNNTGTIGGAIYSVGGVVTVTDAEFVGNGGDEGGGMAISGAGTYTIENNLFSSNLAALDGGGLALRDFDSALSTVRNNRFQDNIADGGGGAVAMIGATAAVSMVNNTFTGNEAVAGEGGGILLDAPNAAGAQVIANVMHSCDGNSAFHVNATQPPLVIYNTIFGTNSGNHFSGLAGDGLGNPVDPNSFVRNPLLVAFSDDLDPTNDDLTLQAGSPEVDSGPPVAQFDDTDGSTNDRGFTGGPAAD